MRWVLPVGAVALVAACGGHIGGAGQGESGGQGGDAAMVPATDAGASADVVSTGDAGGTETAPPPHDAATAAVEAAAPYSMMCTFPPEVGCRGCDPGTICIGSETNYCLSACPPGYVSVELAQTPANGVTDWCMCTPLSSGDCSVSDAGGCSCDICEGASSACAFDQFYGNLEAVLCGGQP